MRLWKRMSRRALAASVLVCSLAGVPALAQTGADLNLTVAPADSPPRTFSFVSGVDFAVNVTNDSFDIRDVATKATITLANVPAGYTIASSGCANDADFDGSIACELGDLAAQASADVTFTVTPKKLPTTCDTTTAVSPTFTAAFTSDLANGILADPNPANDSATDSATASPVTDIGVTLDGPTGASEGQTVTYTSVVTNNGPCDAENVLLTVDPINQGVGNALGLTPVANTGDCTTPFLGDCALGTIPAGGFKTVTSSYTVEKIPGSGISNLDENDVGIASDTEDSDSSNDTATVTTLVQSGSSGCSTAGTAGASSGLVALAILALVMRRKRH